MLGCGCDPPTASFKLFKTPSCLDVPCVPACSCGTLFEVLYTLAVMGVGRSGWRSRVRDRRDGFVTSPALVFPYGLLGEAAPRPAGHARDRVLQSAAQAASPRNGPQQPSPASTRSGLAQPESALAAQVAQAGAQRDGAHGSVPVIVCMPARGDQLPRLTVGESTYVVRGTC